MNWRGNDQMRVCILFLLTIASCLMSDEQTGYHQVAQEEFFLKNPNLELANTPSSSSDEQPPNSLQEPYFKLPESLSPGEDHSLQPIEETFSLFFEPKHRTTLFSQVLTTILTINKQMGQGFLADEAIITLDSIVYKAKFEKSEALVAKAQTELTAKQQLYHDNVASLFELKTAEANLAQAIFEFEVSKKELDACQVTVPYNGKVITILVDEGELVQVGQTLGQSINDQTLIGKLLVPPHWLSKIEIGQSLDLKVNETGTVVKGKIIRIDAVMDPSSALTRVDLEVDNSDDTLRGGMSATTLLRESPSSQQ